MKAKIEESKVTPIKTTKPSKEEFVKTLQKDLRVEKMLHSRLKKKVAGIEAMNPAENIERLENQVVALLDQVGHYQEIIRHTAAITQFRITNGG